MVPRHDLPAGIVEIVEWPIRLLSPLGDAAIADLSDVAGLTDIDFSCYVDAVVLGSVDAGERIGLGAREPCVRRIEPQLAPLVQLQRVDAIEWANVALLVLAAHLLEQR